MEEADEEWTGEKREEETREEEDVSESDDEMNDFYDVKDAQGRSEPLQPKKHLLAAIENKINLHMMFTVESGVAGTLKKHDRKEEDRRDKVKDKSDRATNEQVLDDRTRLVIFKLMKGHFFGEINGCISTGKEANVYYCENFLFPPDPNCKSPFKQLALKVFKTSILVFKDRDRYVTGEFRFRRGYAKSNPRKMVKMWAEKEYRNLIRLRKGGIHAPEPVVVRSHLLLMEFLGTEGWPSPRLKDAVLKPARLLKCYKMLLLDMRKMYHSCRLVHADLSEYNILYHEKKLYIIDVSQSVEHDHPHALEFLRSDCANVTRFFSKNGVSALRMRELFEFVCALELPAPEEEHLETLLEVARQRGPMTEEELVEENVFARVFIPRTLGELADPEKELKSGQNTILNATGLDVATKIEAEVEGSEEEDDEHSETQNCVGFDPSSPLAAARTLSLFCVACLPAPVPVRLMIGKHVWSTRDDPAWMKLFKRVHKLSKQELKQERRDNKVKVKQERKVQRETKIPKKDKKRALKQSTKKKGKK